MGRSCEGASRLVRMHENPILSRTSFALLLKYLPSFPGLPGCDDAGYTPQSGVGPGPHRPSVPASLDFSLAWNTVWITYCYIGRYLRYQVGIVLRYKLPSTSQEQSRRERSLCAGHAGSCAITALT